MRRSFIITIIALVCWAGAEAAARTDLTSLPQYLPYHATPSQTMGISQTGQIYGGDAIVQLDIDQDGQPDLIYSRPNYLAARSYSSGGNVTFYQTNYPPDYCGDEKSNFSPAVRLCGDLDGDGREDLVVMGPARDNSLWWFWIVDPFSGHVKQKFTLPVGEDVRPDGKWDGRYFAVGQVNVQRGTEEIRALVIGCSVRYDKYGRGVLAVDPRDGNILWRYQTGPLPFQSNTRLVDLDGDGQDEIVFVGRSPDNLGGEKINGFSDDETRLFVVDRQGKLRWSQHLCDSYGNGELVVGDMDGDGLPELVTSAHTTPEVWGELVIWDRDGTALARLDDKQQFRGVCLVRRSEHAAPSLLVTSSDLELQEYDYRNGNLSLRRAVKLPAMSFINYVGDFLPEQGVEIVITPHGGQTLVLDENLDPLTVLAGTRSTWCARAQIWQPQAGVCTLYWPYIYSPAQNIIRTPFAWQRLKPLAAGVAVLGLLAVLWWLRRRAPRINEHVLHETRLNLLDNLELSNHGAIAPLKCVRRLIWHLRALQTDLGDSAKVEVRMREAWSECRETALPHLQGIIDRARLAGVGSDGLKTISTAITVVGNELENLSRAEFQISQDVAIADRLEDAEQQADAALIRLRAEVTTYFRADVARAVARVQSARALDISQAGVNFQVGYAAAAAGGTDVAGILPPLAVGLCDPRELEFVLDNLVGNAITAMKSSSPRNLHLTWRTTDGMIIIDVTDTGCGLAEEHWDRALNSHYSTKPSGGEGLPHSRKYLRKYGGSLSILRSAPGKGATFRVTLPVN